MAYATTASTLPTETLTNIFVQIGPDGFNPDYDLLLSTALVCRKWSSIVVPLMWQRPLQLLVTKDNHESAASQIATLVNCLAADARNAIANRGIKLPKLPAKPPAFAYASFAKEITDYYLYDAVWWWLRAQGADHSDDGVLQDVLAQIVELFVKQKACIRSLSLTATCGLVRDAANSFARIPSTLQLVHTVEELIVGGQVSSQTLEFYAQACTGVKHLQVIAPCPVNNGLVAIVKANPKITTISIEAGCDESNPESLTRTHVGQIANIISLTSGELRQLHIKYLDPADSWQLPKVYEAITKHCPNLVNLRVHSSKETVSLLPPLLNKCTKLETVILEDDTDYSGSESSADDDDYEVDITSHLPEIGTVMPHRMRVFILGGDSVEDEEALMDFLDGVESRVKVHPMRLHFWNIDEFDSLLDSYENRGVIEPIHDDDLYEVMGTVA